MSARESSRPREILVEVAAKAVDRALAGPWPEAFADAIVKHNVIERVADRLLRAYDAGELELEATERLAQRIVSSSSFQRILLEALESQFTPEVAERLLRNPETERMIGSLVASPAVRNALAAQTSSLAGEMADELRNRTIPLDDAVERVVRRRADVAPARYAGAVTRSLAFGVDLAIADVLFLIGAAMVGLVAELAGGLRPDWLLATLAGTGWTLVVGSYFVFFWTVLGRTPGMSLMRLRLADPSGLAPPFGRSVLRFAGLLLAIAPAFLGLLPVLFDTRRRGLHDFLAGTVVVYDVGDQRE
jgi:uncharacterized RDD family membrane protein YckC